MTRSVPSWRGKTPDTAPPPRVIARLFHRQEGRCAICTRKLGVAGEPYAADHIVALVNGGENAEANLQLVCEDPCHRSKTRADVAEKAETARKRAKHVIGVKRKSKWGGGKWRRKMDGTVERVDV